MFSSILFLIAALMTGPQQEKTENLTPYVVIYNIQDLKMVTPDYTDVPQMDLNAVLSGNKGSPFTNSPNQSKPNQKNPQAIISLIESLVEPEAWGDIATIKYWNGNLIIKAPKRIHDQIK